LFCLMLHWALMHTTRWWQNQFLWNLIMRECIIVAPLWLKRCWKLGGKIWKTFLGLHGNNYFGILRIEIKVETNKGVCHTVALPFTLKKVS
jgi:hypothetical protein